MVKRFNHRRRPLSAILIKGEDMYAIVNAKQFKEAIKQIKALGGYAVQVKKDGEVLHMSSYQMPNNCYNSKGEPQYHPYGDLLLVDVKFKLEMPLQNGNFKFVTTIDDLKAGGSCADGGLLEISFEDDKAWCEGKYSQSLSLVDVSASNFGFKEYEYDDLVVFDVPVDALQFTRPFTMCDDLDKRGFNNICIEEGGIVATDGHALGVKVWNMGDGCELGYQVPIQNGVADAILASKADTVTISAHIKQLEVLNPLNHEKELVKRFVGTYISSGDYSFLVKVENEFRFPDFKKVFPPKYDNQFLIDSDKWAAVISNLIKGFNYPVITVTDEPGNFVFTVHEIRPKKGCVAIGDRQAKVERAAFNDYAWETFKCDAKILLKTLKALDSAHTLIHIHNPDLIVLESWAGKAIVMQMQ